MIDIISNWAGELIVSLVIVTILEMLLPDNKTKKYVKTVIGVYIIFCIISPFINKNQIEDIIESTEKSLEKIQVQSQVSGSQNGFGSIEALYIEEFEKDVIRRVEDLGYEVKKCEVDVEINANKENAGVHAIYLKIRKKEQDDKNKENSSVKIEEIEEVEISINDQKNGNNNNEETGENGDSKKIKELLSSYYEIEEENIKIFQD